MSATRSCKPRRRWGSHRLGPGFAEGIVETASIRPGELVLDLGAGTGALTRPLARRSAQVIAVELHPGRAEGLRAGTRSTPQVTVLEQDLLTVPLPRRRFRVVANPPYAVAAALVRRITARDSHLVRADLVLPRWQVRRYGADPPRGWIAQLGRHVPASAFRPPPRADSAVLILLRRRHTR